MQVEQNKIWLSTQEVCKVLELKEKSFAGDAGRKGAYKSVGKKRITNDKGWELLFDLNTFPDAQKQILCKTYKIESIEAVLAFENSKKENEQTLKHKAIIKRNIEVYRDTEDYKYFFSKGFEVAKCHLYSLRCAYLRFCSLPKIILFSTLPQELQESKKQVLELVSELIFEEKVFYVSKASYSYLQKLIALYNKAGKESVIDNRADLENARKVDELHKRVITAIALGLNNPSKSDVCRYYTEFLSGDNTIVDTDTGEVYEPKNFNTLSDATIYNYLNRPVMKQVIAKEFGSKVEYESKYRPFLHGERPKLALSMLSCDDWELPVFVNGKRPVTYACFDVATGVMLSFVRLKNNEKTGKLFELCIQKMLTNPILEGNMPFEIQTEQHICSLYKDTLLKEGNVFQYVSIEEGERPMAKYAEGFIKQVKYQVLKGQDFFRGRPHARVLANKFNKNKKIVNITEQELDNLMLNIVEAWNSLPAFEGDTISKLERFKNSINQKANPIYYPVVAKYLGRKIETTLRNNQYFTANNQRWILPNSEVIKDLVSQNIEVRILEDIKDRAFMFQNDKFICETSPVERVQRAKAEQENQEDNEKLMSEFMQYRNATEAIAKEERNNANGIALSKKDLTKDYQKELQKEKDKIQVEEWQEEEENDYLKLYEKMKKKKTS